MQYVSLPGTITIVWIIKNIKLSMMMRMSIILLKANSMLYLRDLPKAL